MTHKCVHILYETHVLKLTEYRVQNLYYKSNKLNEI